jgi:hypothetical protein
VISVLYSGGRPEMTPHDEESKKAVTTELKSIKGTKDET